MASKVSLGMLFTLLHVTPVLAQGATVPAAMNGVEGGYGTNVPFGISQACRYQCIYDADLLPWVGPREISGIRIRADNGTPGNPRLLEITGKGYLVISVTVSTTSTSASSPSADFDLNHGIDKTLVLDHHVMQLPTQPVITGPRPANIDLPFTTPWWYGLVPARGGQPVPDNLVVEVHIHSQPSGLYPVDNLSGCQATKTNFGNLGPACIDPSQSQPAILSSDASMTAGSAFSWEVQHGPPNTGVIFAFSPRRQTYVAGAPIYPTPYPMFDPANPSQPSAALAAAYLNWSAPDCWFNVYSTFTLVATTDAVGTASVVTQLPAGSRYVGLELFAQAYFYAQSANPLQVVSTLGHSSEVCGPLEVVRIWSFYNSSTPPPTAGSVDYGLGMVLEVY